MSENLDPDLVGVGFALSLAEHRGSQRLRKKEAARGAARITFPSSTCQQGDLGDPSTPFTFLQDRDVSCDLKKQNQETDPEAPGSPQSSLKCSVKKIKCGPLQPHKPLCFAKVLGSRGRREEGVREGG